MAVRKSDIEIWGILPRWRLYLHPRELITHTPGQCKQNPKRGRKESPGAPTLKCHTFRHSVASYLIYEGHDVVTVSKMLGHASISTTLNYYAHAMPKGQRELADSLESFSKRA